MRSKLLTRKGKSGGVYSSPQEQKKGFSFLGESTDGNSIPLSYEYYHTIVLFGVPSLRAHLLRALAENISSEVARPTGMHGQKLRQVEANGQICHYEWTMDRTKKPRVHQTSLIPLAGPDGKVNSILSVTKDITDWSSTQPQMLREGSTSRTFSQILLGIHEDEKRELAKALHDEIGSASVMLMALISLMKQNIELGNGFPILESLDQLHQQIRASMERLHAIVVSLRPPSLETDGALRGSIEELLENVCQLGGIAYHFDCDPDFPEKGICDSVKILLYRVVQEALNNVVKHAHAANVTVSLKRHKSRLVLVVQDDGRGFEREKRLSVKHIGLLSMRDSIHSIGGRITIQTAPNQGTCIRAVCPCIVYEENQ